MTLRSHQAEQPERREPRAFEARPAQQAQRCRVRFSKLGKIRFTSHRDVARIWERALRRAELPIAYTEGYTPRPKLSFGLALSTGYESHGEYLDIALREASGRVELNELPRRLAAALPEGIEVQAVVALPEGAESLQQAVTSCTWHIDVGAALPAAVAHAMAAALAAPELVVTRQRKGRSVTDDVRPAILSAEVLGGTTIEADLATQPRGLRPAEFLAAIDPTWRAARVTRISQWTQVGGARREVIDLPRAATPPPHAEVRAS
ncbi:MAG TPA: TIGR03936 family radical SAM-associated protein [Acidimicrobiales bacterium]|nr:TIGR03936 family radical SAM-associated protein [Acidimicrobiales bacterium]